MSARRATCRKCGAELERDATKKRPFYHCKNLLCPSHQKSVRKIGNVIVGGFSRPKE